MKYKFSYYWLLFSIPFFFVLWFFFSKASQQPLRYLAYFGPKNFSKLKDTSYHTIPSFQFTDQDGEEVDKQSMKDKIYVTEYFFTTCTSICPVMNKNLDKVYATFKEKDDFLILSHTVDPETDSISVLKQYATLHGVNDKKWLFVTGSKQHLYELARKGYLLNAEEGNGGPEDFIHTQNFALIDKEHHIRGYYNGTDSIEVSHLIRDIKLLYQEYDYKKQLMD
jgi:protein SCO1/2